MLYLKNVLLNINCVQMLSLYALRSGLNIFDIGVLNKSSTFAPELFDSANYSNRNLNTNCYTV